MVNELKSRWSANAFGVEIAVKRLAGWGTIDKLNCPDLDDAMTAQRVETGVSVSMTISLIKCPDDGCVGAARGQDGKRRGNADRKGVSL
jgi:hypothetical protein